MGGRTKVWETSRDSCHSESSPPQSRKSSLLSLAFWLKNDSGSWWQPVAPACFPCITVRDWMPRCSGWEPQLSLTPAQHPAFFKPDASGPESSCEFNPIPLFQQHIACLGSVCSPLIWDIHHSKTFLDMVSYRNYKLGMDSYHDSLVNSLKIANGNTNRLESLLYFFFLFSCTWRQNNITY